MKRILPLLLAACLVFSLTGCRSEDHEEPGTHLSLQPSAGEPLPGNAPASGTAPAGESRPGGESSLTFECTPGDFGARYLVSGKLIYTVTGARAVSDRAGIPEGAFQKSADDVLMFPNGEGVEYRYPDFIQEDGSFIDGAYLILVDMTVESQDAANLTAAEVDENGVKGKYDSPYIFRADYFFCLTDLSEEGQTGGLDSPIIQHPKFFSLCGQREEHSFAFELLPGETIAFTIGFLVGDYPSGAPRSLSELCLTDVMGTSAATFVHLNLEDS